MKTTQQSLQEQLDALRYYLTRAKATEAHARAECESYARMINIVKHAAYKERVELK